MYICTCLLEVFTEKCVNCDGNHTASYKGCFVHQQIVRGRRGATSHHCPPLQSIISSAALKDIGLVGGSIQTQQTG